MPNSTEGRLNYLDADAIAERLGVTRKWVQHYTREGVIPVIRIGRRCFYTENAVDTAMRALETNQPACR